MVRAETSSTPRTTSAHSPTVRGVQKCDGARPVCSQCSKANRGAECQYYEKKRTSRTQLLQAKITKLEARLRELEAEQSPLDSSSSSGSQSPQIDRASLALQRAFPPAALNLRSSQLTARACGSGVGAEHDLGLGFDASAFSTPELDDFLLGSSSDTFPPLDGDAFFGISSPSSSSSGAGWAGGGLLAGAADVDDFLGSGTKSSTINVRNASGGSAIECTWWENDVFCENKQLLYGTFPGPTRSCD